MLSASSRAHLSFGTYEVDLESGELRKAGLRVRLAAQPFRVLTVLLSRPGEIVTHEDLQRELWGANTNVDFERGIAGAINKVRDALGDSADNPRFIETLSKRGYRFIAPVSVEPASEYADALRTLGASHEKSPRPENSSAPAANTALNEADLAPSAQPAKRADRPTQASRRNLRGFVLSGSAVLLMMALSSWLTYELTHRSKPYRPSHVEQLTSSSEIYSGPPNPENLLTMVSDGPRLYTSVLADGRMQIASITVNGAQVQPVGMPDELSSVTIADLSPDGSKLLVRSRHFRDSEQPLWIVPTTGGSALRVGEVVAHDATWMSGGNSILYASDDQLGIVQLDTGAVTIYATLPGRAFWLRWSPDGTRLRFTLLDPVTHLPSLWELDPGSRHATPLRYPELRGLRPCCGSWTPDGKTYVFQASNSQESNIWAVTGGSHGQLTELTNGPLRYMSPLPARGGARMLYAVGLEQPGGTRLYDVKLHQFVPAPPYLAEARRVAYSRDGRWVAWTDANGRLWRARSADGSGRLQLTEDGLEVFLAQWSPDGQQLLLMARKFGETWRIYTVSAEGGDTRLVLADPRNLADPDWSPDGREIVFGRQADLMGKEDGPHTLQFLDLATRKILTLPGSQGLFSPRWSPDGRWVVALSLDQTKLLLYDTQHATWRTIFTGGAADPVWSSDSNAVFIHAFAEANSAILRLSLNGDAQPVAGLSQLSSPSADNFFFSGVTPSGMPIVEPRIGTGNLYSVTLPTRH